MLNASVVIVVRSDASLEFSDVFCCVVPGIGKTEIGDFDVETEVYENDKIYDSYN